MSERRYSGKQLSGFRRDYLNDSSSSPNDSSESPQQQASGDKRAVPSSHESLTTTMQQQMHTNNVISQSTIAGPSKLLAQEIHDEFLICKICLDIYKNPKCLNCLHTFCEDCIENHISSETTYKKFSDYRDFTCPLCRKRTQLPIGGVRKLPDNFLVSSLAEMVSRKRRNTGQSSGELHCDICMLIAKRTREANHRCLECNKLLCKQCVDMHHETKVTRNHSIFGVEIEKDIICRQHDNEIVRFYCEPCQVCICVMCTFNEHRDHEVSSFNDAVGKYKSDLEFLLISCQKKIDAYENNMARIEKTEKVIGETKQKIRDLAIEFIAMIRQSERVLLEDIQSIYGESVFELVARKGELQSQLDNLKKTCSLTQVILQGKDMELLLLKKDLQEKLNMLSQNVDLVLPENLNKIVCFTPGHVELGILDDFDTPLDKRNNFAYKLKPKTLSQTTQTEPDTETPEKLVVTGDKGCQTEIKTFQNVGVGEFAAKVSTDERGINTRSRCVMHPTSSAHQQAVVSIVPVVATPPLRVESSNPTVSSYCAPIPTTNPHVNGSTLGDEQQFIDKSLSQPMFDNNNSMLEMSTNEKLMRARQRRRMNEMMQAQGSVNSDEASASSIHDKFSVSHDAERDGSTRGYVSYSSGSRGSVDTGANSRYGSTYYGNIY